MRRYLVAAGSFTLLLASAISVAGAQEVDHVVVADGLENPRQLNWSGDTLLIAEGGQGGDNCAPEAAAAPPETPATETPPTESEATESEATESEATESEATESEATESEATESEATESEATESEATES